MSFYTDILKKDEEQFWRIGMRRLTALFTLHFNKQDRIDKAKEMEKQNKALEQMRAL
ncbi:hypothetical protein J2Z82_003256 [Virgibacillus litoralis]|uniref:Uncharacterized protein n=1 Tax=Virgibacillus litoralis TaxID=578221 RepID=A0ABS4HHU5_9BACI|nr:hypothetical protein [Virgibacillus litoralis]